MEHKMLGATLSVTESDQSDITEHFVPSRAHNYGLLVPWNYFYMTFLIEVAHQQGNLSEAIYVNDSNKSCGLKLKVHSVTNTTPGSSHKGHSQWFRHIINYIAASG